MLLSIFPYHVISYVLAHCCKEIYLLPEMTSPQLVLDFRKFLEDLATRNALENSKHFRYRIPGPKSYQYVNMVLRYLTSIYFKIKVIGNLQKKPVYPRPGFLYKDLFSVLRTPDQMILSFISCSHFMGKAPFPQCLIGVS